MMIEALKKPHLVSIGLLFAVVCVVMQPQIGVTAAGEEDKCYSDWSSAGPVVRSESLVSPKDLRRQAESRLEGRVIKITLCREKNRLVYRLVVFRKNGKLETKIVDARRPF